MREERGGGQEGQEGQEAGQAGRRAGSTGRPRWVEGWRGPAGLWVVGW